MGFSDERPNIHKKLDHSLFLQSVLASNFTASLIFNSETIVEFFIGILKIGRIEGLELGKIKEG